MRRFCNKNRGAVEIVFIGANAIGRFRNLEFMQFTEVNTCPTHARDTFQIESRLPNIITGHGV